MSNFLIPTVIVKEDSGERAFDIYSRMLNDRIIFVDDRIDSESASIITAELLFLESEDPTSDIYMYINSPGGSVVDGMAIYDTMNYIKCDINTVCMGMAASMGAFLLCAGTPGKRTALPNSEIMIHQPLGGYQGQASDIEIHAKNILNTKKKLISIMADSTNGKTNYNTMLKLCDRDNFLTPEEALNIGLIDSITTRNNR